MNVASTDEEGLKKALAMISDLTAVPEVGKTYLGKVVRLAEFGAFVEIFPGTDGLLHISEIAEHRVKEVKDELREGDQVLVKVLGIEGNRIKLSRKALLKEQREKLGLPEPSRGGDHGGGEAPAGALRDRNPQWNGSRFPMPAPSPLRVGKTSMTMSHLSRAGKSQTSIGRMVRPMPLRRRFAGRLGRVVPEVPGDSGAGGIVAGVVDLAAVPAAAAAVARSKRFASSCANRGCAKCAALCFLGSEFLVGVRAFIGGGGLQRSGKELSLFMRFSAGLEKSGLEQELNRLRKKLTAVKRSEGYGFRVCVRTTVPSSAGLAELPDMFPEN